MGAKSKVAKQLLGLVQRPVCIIHYVAHNLELAVLNAMTKFPYLATFEESVKTRNREVN